MNWGFIKFVAGITVISMLLFGLNGWGVTLLFVALALLGILGSMVKGEWKRDAATIRGPQGGESREHKV